MKCLVFDTETTGLPKCKFVKKNNIHLWPHIVQLSYIVYDTEKNKILVEQDEIVKVNDDIEIPEESTKIHGITNEASKLCGQNISVLLEHFVVCFNRVDCIVGHNVEFDIKMLLVECYRNNYKDNLFIEMLKNAKRISSPKLYCTMNVGKELCNIVIQNKYTGEKFLKSPKLIELHEKIFSQTPKHLHNSFNDIIITLRCFYFLEFGEDLCSKDRKFNTMINKLL